MRLLDLFCGAGGCSVGYHRAGFTEVVGVDVAPQFNYPFSFVQSDAMTYPLDGFDFIHASPPCQGYVGWQNITTARGGSNDWPKLIAPIRERLIESGIPYVIENVENAGPDMRGPLKLCGSQFGLGVRRHRLFECSFFVMSPGKCNHTGDEVGVYGKLDGRRLFTRKDGSELRNPASLEQAQNAMGINWMGWDELKEAIPPAYTQFIGEQLIQQLKVAS